MKPDVLAAIDIGTNSFHLVVAKVDASHIEVIEHEREMVRLGSSDGDMRLLTSGAIDRAVETLARFRQVAEIHDAPVRAAATSAVREAENRHVFLQRARAEAGVTVEIISGFEEARLIHLGVLQAVPVFDRTLLLCDIGGGSTELLIGRQADVLLSRSFKLGAIRLTRQFFPGGDVPPDAVDRCRASIRATIAPSLADLRRHGHEVAVGSSGTIGSVCAMAAVRREETDGTGGRPRTLNNYTVTREEIGAVVRKLAAASSAEERATLPGLDPRRADIILAGALILEEVVTGLEIEALTFSDYALREGLLLDTWQRRHGGSLHHLSELRRRSVLKLMDAMDEDPAHSAEVARLALELFDATADRHGLGDDSRELLEAAALLCNIGLFVSHAGHHKHSYYLIRNSEHLTGFTDQEIEVIAQTARYHRKSVPRAKHGPFAALSPEDRKRVRILAGLLRVAVGLDRNHTGRVATVRAHLDAGAEDGDALVVEAVPRSGEDISLELDAAAERQALLASTLSVNVVVRQGDGSA